MTTSKKKPDLEQLLATADPMARLLGIMALLRDPEHGCPWDREQTLHSLKQYLVEETYETLDAIDSGEPDRLQGELGDVLLQIVFQSQLAGEQDWFSFHDVAEGLCRKLVRRHPHIFSTSKADTASEVLSIWESSKRKEGGGLLDGIPRHMPALQKAHRLSQKASRVGFDWPDVSGVVAKVGEEAEELVQAKGPDEQFHEIGDLMFALANLARHMDINPEEALQRANHRFKTRFAHVEASVADMDCELADLTLAQLEELWQEAKGEVG